MALFRREMHRVVVPEVVGLRSGADGCVCVQVRGCEVACARDVRLLARGMFGGGEALQGDATECKGEVWVRGCS